MKKNIIIILIIIVILLSTIGMIILVNKNNTVDNTIPSDYIAVFKGETGEIVHTTYLYEKKEIKKKKKKKTIKYTYKYINTVSTLNGYDSTNWEEKVLKKDKLKKKKDIFKNAEKNNATSYVKYIKDEQVYTFEDFKNIWK